MRKIPDLPETLPLFPLAGALLLPRAHLPLHIFEPRYLAMLDDCLKTPARLIGMIQPQGEGDRLSAIGCAGRITGFRETEDGRYMITLLGISRFRYRSDVAGFTPYRRGVVEWAPFARDLGPEEADSDLNRTAFLALLDRFLAAQRVEGDLSGMKDADTELLINALSMLLPLSPEDKQALLEAPTLPTRRETLITLMEYALHSGGGQEALQ